MLTGLPQPSSRTIPWLGQDSNGTLPRPRLPRCSTVAASTSLLHDYYTTYIVLRGNMPCPLSFRMCCTTMLKIYRRAHKGRGRAHNPLWANVKSHPAVPRQNRLECGHYHGIISPAQPLYDQNQQATVRTPSGPVPPSRRSYVWRPRPRLHPVHRRR